MYYALSAKKESGSPLDLEGLGILYEDFPFDKNAEFGYFPWYGYDTQDKCPLPEEGVAVSSLKCNTLLKVHDFTRKYFSWSLKVEAFARAVVELSGNCVEVALRELRQIQTLGKILADQTVGILVGRPLPGAVGVGKIDVDLDAFGQNLMARHLPALVVGE